jgi:hypothetical protein
MKRLLTDKPRPLLYVDFNELLEPDLVLLSKGDTKADVNGIVIQLCEGLAVSVFMDDVDSEGRRDDLVANGVVERNHDKGWSKHVK